MTLTDLDLAHLRDDIQDEVLLPSFADVERRAVRHRRRGRLRRALGLTSLLAGLVPLLGVSGLMAARATGHSGVLVFNVGDGRGQGDVLPGPEPTVDAQTHDLIAVDSGYAGSVYGLVDVCLGPRCSLQLISIGGDNTPGQMVYGNSLLRSDQTDRLSRVRLTVVNPGLVAVSGYISGHPDPTDAWIDVHAGTPARSRVPAVRPVQVESYQAIATVAGNDGIPQTLIHQPPLRQPRLASVTKGWWVTGTDPTTGRIGVSVSRDNGVTWKTTVLEVTDPNVDVSLSTADGLNVYAVYGMAGAIMITRSRDGGRSWDQPAPVPLAVLGTAVGVYVAGNGAVVAWTYNQSGTSTVRSDDRGGSWHPVVWPTNGPIVAVAGGRYFSLGASPQESPDGLTWTPAATTYSPIN